MIEFQKTVTDLGLYDQVIPQIIAELLSRAAEHVFAFVQFYREYRKKVDSNLEKLKDYHLDRD